MEAFISTMVIASARIGTFVIISPFFRGRQIPNLAKISIIICLAMFVANNITSYEVETVIELILIILSEVIIGAILAITLEILFSLVRVAGALIDVDIGLANPFFDNTLNQQITPVSRLFNYLFLLIFILIGGVEKTISAVIYTFNFELSSSFLQDKENIYIFLDLVEYMFFGALQIALPFMMATFLVYIALLLMTKTVDKINILMNIFGVKILLGMIMLFLCIPIIITVFIQLEQGIYERFIEVIEMVVNRRGSQ